MFGKSLIKTCTYVYQMFREIVKYKLHEITER